MKNSISFLVLVSVDVLAICIAIIMAFYTRTMFSSLIELHFDKSLSDFFGLYMMFISILGMLFYEGVYSKRFDFWHETKQIIKSLFFAFLLVMSYLAITKSVDDFSRFVIVFIFIYLAILIPLFKNIVKSLLFKLEFWQKKAYVYGEDEFLQKEIFSNHYLGYVCSDLNSAHTIFVNSQNIKSKDLQKIIDKELHAADEILFIPRLNEYELSQSFIYELSNTRTNLVEIKNRLKSRYRLFSQQLFNYVLALLLLPILLPIIGILAFLIKKESPGPVFFAHKRIGKNGAIIPTYKFRSMFSDAEERLEKLLKSDEEIKKEWESNFKIKDDPRITKIGYIMRKTSLDELPQIFNVLKGEMNFVGPRPVIQQEIKQYYKEDAEYYFMVKPGITGLWQVSGRSDTDYDFRVATDKWYVMNWSLWLDIVILFKTVKVVLFREGAY
jgi:undecaprenyl-phosphate galactose phosphotransferase